MEFSDLMELRVKYKSQVTLREAETLFNYVINTPAGIVVEVGSASGGTTVVLLDAAKSVNKSVVSVDTYPVELEEVAWQYEKGAISKLENEFTENILNGLWDNIVQIKKEIPDCIDELPYISMVFLDGLHEYSFAKRDFDLLIPKVVSGGAICIHDIFYVKGQLTEYGGLAPLMREFCLNPLFFNFIIVDSMLCGVKK